MNIEIDQTELERIRAEKRAKHQEWLTNLVGVRCECGNLAIKRDSSKSPVCQRCLDAEAKGYEVTSGGMSDDSIDGWAAQFHQALDAYWIRRGIPEPEKEFVPTF